MIEYVREVYKKITIFVCTTSEVKSAQRRGVFNLLVYFFVYDALEVNIQLSLISRFSFSVSYGQKNIFWCIYSWKIHKKLSMCNCTFLIIFSRNRFRLLYWKKLQFVNCVYPLETLTANGEFLFRLNVISNE